MMLGIARHNPKYIWYNLICLEGTSYHATEEQGRARRGRGGEETDCKS